MVINNRENLDKIKAPWIGLSELFLLKENSNEVRFPCTGNFGKRNFT